MPSVSLLRLCAPAYTYLVISAISMAVILYQNRGNLDKYCVGSMTCDVSSTAMIFIIKALYILFWTWVLNIICKSGSTGIAWFILFLPFILMFIFISYLFV